MSVIMILIMFGLFLLIVGIVLMLLNTNKNRTKTCPGCKNVIQPNTHNCPYCGYILK